MRETENTNSKSTGRTWVLTALLVALLAEIAIGNFSTWRSLTNQSIDLKQEMLISGEQLKKEGDFVSVPSGKFKIDIPPVDCEIQNLKVQIQLSAGEKLSYILSLTDEGNAYAYSLPEKVVIPSLERTHYLNIYPYGKVSSMSFAVVIPEGSSCNIQAIEANSVIPFSFEWVRFFCFFCILMVLWCFGSKNQLLEIVCKKESKKQAAVTALLVLLLLFLALKLLYVNPLCIKSPWPHQRQYQELATALSKGQVFLDAVPSEELIAAPNPYDTIYLQANNIFYQSDYVYFNGHYYVYFGLVPELLLYLPCLRITGHQLPNYLAFFCFYCLFVVSVFALLREVVRQWFQKIPFLVYLTIGCLFAMSSGYLYLLARPDLYHVPIIAANAFAAAGLFFWMKALEQKKFRLLWLFAGSLSMALVVGCRPQMFLFSLLALPLFWKKKEQDRIIFTKNSWKESLSFILPYLLVAIILMYYNAARFGSVFDFGATYSLTSNDMTKRGFNLSRLFIGLFSFLLQPPVLDAEFPFLQHNLIHNSYMGKLITEFTYGGILTANLFLWSTFFLGKAKGVLQEKGVFWFSLTGTICAVFLAGFDVNGAGILQRYTGDFLFGFLLTSSLLVFALTEKLRGTAAFRLLITFIVMSLFWNTMYGGMVVFASGDTVNLANNNTTLFYYIASLFSS